MSINNNLEKENLKELLNKKYQDVCNGLFPKERLTIIKSLENRSCMTCTNGNCRVEYDEKMGNDELGRPQGYECLGWYNETIIGKSKVLSLKNVYDLK